MAEKADGAGGQDVPWQVRSQDWAGSVGARGLQGELRPSWRWIREHQIKENKRVLSYKSQRVEEEGKAQAQSQGNLEMRLKMRSQVTKARASAVWLWRGLIYQNLLLMGYRPCGPWKGWPGPEKGSGWLDVSLAHGSVTRSGFVTCLNWVRAMSAPFAGCECLGKSRRGDAMLSSPHEDDPAWVVVLWRSGNIREPLLQHLAYSGMLAFCPRHWHSRRASCDQA